MPTKIEKDDFGIEDYDDTEMSVSTIGIVSKHDFPKAITSILNLVKAIKFNNSNLVYSFDPGADEIKSGISDTFKITKLVSGKKIPVYAYSKNEGCKIFQPIDDNSLKFMECMYPKAERLSVTKCNLSSAIKLIDLYEGKGTKLEFSDEIKAKIEALSDTPEKAKFMEYYNKVSEDRTSQNRTKFGR